MTGAVLLDTHAWAWALTEESRLSEPAMAAIARADAVYVSPISFFEIGQKVRAGKWPELEPFAPRLMELLHAQGAIVAPLTSEMCLRAGLAAWEHRDPFDRLLAVTAMTMGVQLVSRDAVFSALPDLQCIW